MSGIVVLAWIVLLVGSGIPIAWQVGSRAELSVAARLALAFLFGQLALLAVAEVTNGLGWRWSPGRLASGVALLGAIGLVGARVLTKREGAGRGCGALPRDGEQLERGETIAKVLSIGSAVFLAAAFLSVALRQVREPVWSHDFWVTWGFKAKLFSIHGGFDERLYSEPAFFQSHPGYPLLWPITLAAPMLGRPFDEFALALFAPFLTLLLVAALVGEIRKRGLPLVWAIPFGLLLLSSRNLLGEFNVGPADLPYAVALFVAALGIRALSERGGSLCAASVAACGLLAAVTTKNEGIALFLSSVAVLLWPGRRPRLGPALLALGPAATVLAATSLSRHFDQIAAHSDLSVGVVSAAWTFDRVLTVIRFAAEHLVGPNAVTCVLVIVLVTLGLRAERRISAIGGLLLLIPLAMLPAYVWTRIELGWFLESSLVRVAAPLYPLVLLFSAEGLAAWLRVVRVGETEAS